MIASPFSKVSIMVEILVGLKIPRVVVLIETGDGDKYDSTQDLCRVDRYIGYCDQEELAADEYL
jgi:hypothetical protein